MAYYPQCPHGIIYGKGCYHCAEDYHREVMESYRDPYPSEADEPKQKRGNEKDSGES